MPGLASSLLELAGAVALLLWGAHMVQSGMQRAFGAGLSVFLRRALRHRVPAFFSGVLITAALQSSTATGLIMAGLAADRAVALIPALAVMLGANVGTTLIVQVMSFDIGWLTPILLLAGLTLFRKGRESSRDFGRVLIGLGLMLLSLHQFMAILVQFEHDPTFVAVIGSLADQPVMAIGLGMVLAWAAHSSVAIVLLVMSLAAAGSLALPAALALVIGANLGTALNPLFESGGSPFSETARVPLGNLLTRISGAVMAVLLLPWVAQLIDWLGLPADRAVADFHTGLNLLVALVFLPILPGLTRLLKRLLPDRDDLSAQMQPIFCKANETFTTARRIEAATREAARLADLLETMLVSLAREFASGSRRRIAQTRDLDDVIDALALTIGRFLLETPRSEMTSNEQDQVRRLLAFVAHLEQAADIIDRNLLRLALRKLKRGITIPTEDLQMLSGQFQQLVRNTRLARAQLRAFDPVTASSMAVARDSLSERTATWQRDHASNFAQNLQSSTPLSDLHLEAMRQIMLASQQISAAADAMQPT